MTRPTFKSPGLAFNAAGSLNLRTRASQTQQGPYAYLMFNLRIGFTGKLVQEPLATVEVRRCGRTPRGHCSWAALSCYLPSMRFSVYIYTYPKGWYAVAVVRIQCQRVLRRGRPSMRKLRQGFCRYSLCRYHCNHEIMKWFVTRHLEAPRMRTLHVPRNFI